MTSWNTLCQYRAVSQGSTIYAIGEGYTAAAEYYLYVTSSLPTAADIYTGSHQPADSFGNFVFALNQPGTLQRTYVVHPTATDGSQPSRVSATMPLSWAPVSADHPAPNYLPSAPVMDDPPVAADREARLAWTPSATCDPRHDAILYDLQRSSSGPGAGFATIASNLAATSYVDSGRANEVPLWYRVRAHTTYLNGLITPGAGGFVSAFSNVVTVTPNNRRESWGMLAA